MAILTRKGFLLLDSMSRIYIFNQSCQTRGPEVNLAGRKGLSVLCLTSKCLGSSVLTTTEYLLLCLGRQMYL